MYFNALSLQVACHKRALVDWEGELDTLQEKHTWLLFYRVPRLMTLYHHIQQKTKDGVLKETNFLFKQDRRSQALLKDAIKVE